MKKGFTLVEIMIVVAIIGLLAAIAIPSFMRARTTSQKNSCINNLRQIEAAKDQYALEMGLTNFSDACDFADIGPGATGGSFLKQWPICPASTNFAGTPSITGTSNDYTIQVIGTNAECKIVSGTHVLK